MSRAKSKDVRGMGYGRALLLDGEPAGFLVRLRGPARGAVDHPEGGELVGFGGICTHMGCTLVGPNPCGGAPLVHLSYADDGDRESLVCGPCPCHGTRFDLRRGGLVVLGPATQDLPQLELRVDSEGGVEATGWAGDPDPTTTAWPGESVRG